MLNLTLDPASTALVVIDLQKGIASMPTVPMDPSEVVQHAAVMADAFRARGSLVVLVRVDPGPGGVLFPRPITDIERPPMKPAPDWSEILPELGPKDGDVVITKHQPGAFYGTDLEPQLRRRKIDTIVICGIATNIGVEATARVAFEYGFNLVFVRDAMAARDVDLHEMAITKFFPTIGRVRTIDQVVAALG